MAVTIVVGAWLGSWLDQKFNAPKHLFTIIFSLLFIAIAMYVIIKDVINTQKENDDKKE